MLLVFSLCSLQASSLSFKTIWRTTSPNETITLPIRNGAGVDLTIEWGDISLAIYNDAPIAHIYNTSGIYNVTINGTIKNFGFNSQGDFLKLIDIADWGGFTIGPTDTNIFAGCTNLRVSAPPDNQPTMLPDATLEGMFMNTSFNSPLSWNLTNVISLMSMFKGATQFNQPLNFSNTAGVTDLTEMFADAISFNQPITFDTSGVTMMSFMFSGARSFNQLVNFDTSNVILMNYMFNSTSSFNQPVNFNTSQVTSMSGMFVDATSFNQAISLDTGSVVQMDSMFQGASTFNKPVNFSTTRNVIRRKAKRETKCF